MSKIVGPKSGVSESKSVVKNLLFLSLVQATNFLIPLIILPYLVTVVGIEKFGRIAFAQSLMSYFIIVVDYGFNLTSTKAIVAARDNTREMSVIVGTTLIVKAILSLFSLLLLVVLTMFVPFFSGHATFYLLSFFLVIGQLIMPTWFFQGIEKMQFLAMINVVGKVLFTISIFLLVVLPEDYIFVPLYLSLGNILSGLLGLYIMYTKFELKFVMPTLPQIREELHKGSSIMLSNFAINAYVNFNIIILGIFTNSLVTGYYSIAEKILYCVRQILNIYFQATYPQVCKVVKDGHNHVIRFFRNFFIPFTILVFFVCLGIFLLADYFSLLLIKTVNEELITAIKLLSFVPLVVCLNIPAYQTLLANNFQTSAMIILVSGSVLNLLLNLWLASQYGMIGTISSVIITEVFITMGLHQILRSRHPQIKLTLQK